MSPFQFQTEMGILLTFSSGEKERFFYKFNKNEWNLIQTINCSVIFNS